MVGVVRIEVLSLSIYSKKVVEGLVSVSCLNEVVVFLKVILYMKEEKDMGVLTWASPREWIKI